MTRAAMTILLGLTMATAADYSSEIAAWRQAREGSLKGESGWLNLAGLFWLHEGENRFGREPSNDIVLPDGPPHAGSFHLRNGEVTVTMDGSTRKVAHDSNDSVQVGRLNIAGDSERRQVRNPPAGPRERGAAQFPRHRVVSGERGVADYGAIRGRAAQDPDPQRHRPDGRERISRLRRISGPRPRVPDSIPFSRSPARKSCSIFSAT